MPDSPAPRNQERKKILITIILIKIEKYAIPNKFETIELLILELEENVFHEN